MNIRDLVLKKVGKMSPGVCSREYEIHPIDFEGENPVETFQQNKH
jgi:hypothetical protein